MKKTRVPFFNELGQGGLIEYALLIVIAAVLIITFVSDFLMGSRDIGQSCLHTLLVLGFIIALLFSIILLGRSWERLSKPVRRLWRWWLRRLALYAAVDLLEKDPPD